MARLLPVFLVCWAFLPPVVLGSPTPFRWCAIGSKEMAKCNAFKAALPAIATSAGVDITPDCVLGSNDEDCMKKIKDGDADLITLDGGRIITAGDKYDLQPVVAEDYGGNDGTKYYAVAVAKKSNTGVTLDSLKGKKSCHTGYRRTAGWRVPVGYLLNSQRMNRTGCGDTSDADSAANFFASSCAPGAPAAYSNKLCALCKAPVGYKCVTLSSVNKYVGYHGAFYCMAIGTGDVAFVKHLTAAEIVAEGYHGSLSDYVYLCTDGGRRGINSTSHLGGCNLGANPSHAVMAKDTNSKQIYKTVLLAASNQCRATSTAQSCSNFLIFDSANYNGRNLLFKDSTANLVDIGSKDTYKKWLGDYYLAQEAIMARPPC